MIASRLGIAGRVMVLVGVMSVLFMVVTGAQCYWYKFACEKKCLSQKGCVQSNLKIEEVHDVGGRWQGWCATRSSG